MLKKNINKLLDYILRIKIIRFFSHNNGIILIYSSAKKKFIKGSVKRFGNYLLKNEYEGFNWYSKKIREDFNIEFKKRLLVTQFSTNKISGHKTSEDILAWCRHLDE